MSKQLLRTTSKYLGQWFNPSTHIVAALICAMVLAGCEQLPVESISPEKSIRYLEANQIASGIIVKFKSSASTKSRARALSSAGLTSREDFALLPGLTVSAPPPGSTINEAIANISTNPNVAYVEPDYIYTIEATPSDPDFSLQYGLTQISAPRAWDVNTGSPDTIIAVIDSGVDYNHPDLQGQIWRNPGEVAGNGVDDDGNGFVDDVRGWDFAANDNNPMDEHNHGTHVAGIVGAKANNNEGGSGVDWQVKIMALKFMNAQGQGSTSAAIRAIDYAVANGAKISNNSWGGGSFSQALFDAIQAAQRQGHLFIAAAGNGDANGIGIDNDASAHYPSSYQLDNIVAIAATDQSDQLTRFSNFGRTSVDVAAPGLQIYSTIRNGLYASYSGTSMASPFVSGLAGLLLAQNPNLTTAELKSAILNNADPVAGLRGQIVTGARINAFASINNIPVGAPTTPVAPVEITTPSNTVLGVGDVLQLSATGGDGQYTWRSANPNRVRVTNQATGEITALAVGAARITVSDGTGLVSTALPLEVVINSALSLAPNNLTELNVNDSTQLTVSGGVAPFTWTSSDSTIATVNPNNANGDSATLTANLQGTFRITASDANGTVVNSGIITVINNALTLSFNKTSISVGETLRANISGGTSPYTWNSSNPNVATVNTGGVITGTSAGNATITVTDVAGSSTTANLQVSSPTSPGNGGGTGGDIGISPFNPVIGIGAKVVLKTVATGSQITWKTSNPAIATVSEKGVVTAVDTGQVNITVTDGTSGASASANIEVRSIEITASVLTISGGDTLQLSATGGTAPYKWSVSNSALASIDNNGLLSAKPGSIGGILVKAVDADDISRSVIVTINDATTLRDPQAF